MVINIGTPLLVVGLIVAGLVAVFFVVDIWYDIVNGRADRRLDLTLDGLKNEASALRNEIDLLRVEARDPSLFAALREETEKWNT